MKVAIVHDYLKEYGGAERVVEALHEIFPQAPIFTAYYDPKDLGPHADRVKKWDIRTSWLQKLPGAGRLLSPLRILAPMIFESFDLSEYEVVISSSAIYFAKAVITKPGALHLAYIHTPPRYLYGYATSFNYKKNPLVRIFAEIINHFLRIYDFETSQRPDILLANSKNVAERIKKFYRREAVVVYPPVDMGAISRQSLDVRQSESRTLKTASYFLSLGRLWKGKGVDVVVRAATRLNLPLKVAGTGPELENLKKIAGKSVHFLGTVADDKLPELYTQAKALILAAEDEDFGITAVEAQATGTPVIALRSGGYLETVVDKKTGEFFEKGDTSEETVENLVRVLEKFNSGKYRAEDCQKQAAKFARARFKKEILELIEKNFHS